MAHKSVTQFQPYDFTAVTISTRDATIVTLLSGETSDEVKLLATGTAKRHPEDRHDPELAFDLAFARALEVLKNRHARRVRGLLKHQQDVIDDKVRVAADRERRAKEAETPAYTPTLGLGSTRHSGGTTITTNR